MSSNLSSIGDSFGMPDSYMGQSTGSNGLGTESAKEIYERRKKHLQKSVNDDVSEYHVEHLLDQSVDRKAGILKIEDCMRKMKLLDARGKIWSQEMCLRVDATSIKFVDIHTSEELETFPIQSVQQVKAIPPDPESPNFKTLCGIIVKHPNQKVPEIHLFNCPTIPANIISADINSALADSKSKKAPKSRPETIRQNRQRIAEIYRDNVDVQEKIEIWDQIVKSNTDDYPYFDKPNSPRSSIPAEEEESPEIQAYKINRDVLILNHILDDIEHFVATIKRAVEAARELTIRKSVKKSNKKSRKGDSKSERGMGILQLRSRLPPPEAYRECFQKFKFSFNLMSKLKKHLDNPNSVELIHFLFKPLEIVMESCENKLLASTVMTPLLLRGSIEFLGNCCTSHEISILTDLGKYWNLPRSEFPTDIFFPPYYPRFRSGWQPPPPYKNNEYNSNQLNAFISDQIEQNAISKALHDQQMGIDRSRMNGHKTNHHHHHNSAVVYQQHQQLQTTNMPQQQQQQTPKKQPASRRPGATSPEAYKQFVQKHIQRNKEVNGLVRQESASQPPFTARKLCRAMHDFEARSKHELSVDQDELLDVLDDSQSWWRVRNNYGLEGLVPGDLMLLISSATNPKRQPERPSSPPIAPYLPYMPEPQPSIPIPPPPPVPKTPTPPPTRIMPIDIGRNPKGNLKPVQPMKQQPKQAYKQPQSVLKKPSKIPATPQKQHSYDEDISELSARNQEFLRNEIMERMDAQRQRNFVLPSKSIRSNSIQLSGDSSPQEVRQWLRAHNFSPLTVDSLGVLNGSQIFRLTKEDLVKVCDKEAGRVHSQLLVQRGAGRSSKFVDNELDEIMKRRRSELSAKDADVW